MFNPNDVVHQAQERKSENLQWIERETELKQAFQKNETAKRFRRRVKDFEAGDLMRLFFLHRSEIKLKSTR